MEEASEITLVLARAIDATLVLCAAILEDVLAVDSSMTIKEDSILFKLVNEPKVLGKLGNSSLIN